MAHITITCAADEIDHLNSLVTARNNGDAFQPRYDSYDENDEPVGPVTSGICGWDPVAHQIAYGTALEFYDLFVADGITFATYPGPATHQVDDAGVVMVADEPDTGLVVVGTRP